ncbi:MAG: hypothetical protein DMF40_02790, partial [Verrucomicrobia bacterium]
TVLRMAYLHSDIERFDIHVALEVCEIVIKSATIVAILESRSKMACFEMTPSQIDHEEHTGNRGNVTLDLEKFLATCA